VSHVHFLKQWHLLAANARRALPFISFVHMHATIATYSLLRATPINLLLFAGVIPLEYARQYSRAADL